MQQPKPTYMPYDQILLSIKNGTIKIPQFQRDFVWERSRSARLLDSILKGYPIGTFILWKTKERLRAIKDIGGLNLPTPPDGDYVLQVLDGQQRITSLFAALEGLTINTNEDFSTIILDMDADPESDDALVCPTGEEIPSGHKTMPFCYLRTKTSRELMKAGFTDEQLDRMDKYQKSLSTYPFPYVEILDAPLAVATEIFTRLNTGGRRLTLYEIMVAKTWDEKQGFDLNEKVEGLNIAIDTNGFGTIDHTILMQNTAAIAIQSIRAREVLSMNKQKFIDTWEQAATAIKLAIDFCRSDLGISVRSLLPYQRSLIPLSYYFYLAKNNPTGDTKKRLIDFFYRVGLSERYSSAAETKIDHDLKIIESIQQDKLYQYEYGVDTSADFIKRNGFFRAGKAYIKTLLCVLANAQPLCFETGGRVILDNALMKQKNSRNYHHFFPTAQFGKTISSGLEANHIGNITLIGANVNKNTIRAKLPSDYISDLAKKNISMKECLATHFIDYKGMGIDTNDYDTFFNARCEKIASALSGYIVPQPIDARAPGLLTVTDNENEEETAQE